jgi:hypothetical protein
VSKEPDRSNEALLTMDELEDWLEQETRDSIKAMELRVREATSLVVAYSLGKITREEANERFHRYEHRWREALPGTNAGADKRDKAIVAAVDEAQGHYSSRRDVRTRYERLFPNRSADSKPSR